MDLGITSGPFRDILVEHFSLTPSQQIQAPTGYVSQISDGQIQAPTANGTMVYPSVPVQTGNGAAALHMSSGLGLFAAIFGVALL